MKLAVVVVEKALLLTKRRNYVVFCSKWYASVNFATKANVKTFIRLYLFPAQKLSA